MILVDSRTGSKELLPLFPKGSAQLATLPYGDFSFVGNGPDGPLHIGVERKQVREVAGTISDGRLIAHQIPGLLKEYHVVYLVVEGRWRGDPRSGLLQVAHRDRWDTIQNGSRRFMAADISKFLSSIENMAGVRLRRTDDQLGTSQEILALHGWWTGKEWEDHRSHTAIQFPQPEAALFVKPSLEFMFAALLPGIGYQRAKVVVRKFESVADMVLADEKDWRAIEGIGKGIAEKVVKTIWKKRGES